MASIPMEYHISALRIVIQKEKLSLSPTAWAFSFYAYDYAGYKVIGGFQRYGRYI